MNKALSFWKLFDDNTEDVKKCLDCGKLVTSERSVCDDCWKLYLHLRELDEKYE